MAKSKKETLRLYFPDKNQLIVSIFEIQGANKLDGTKIVRFSIGQGIHIAMSPKMALEIGRAVRRAAKQILEDEPAGEAGDASEA